MEHILIRNLPEGTKAALRAMAARNNRSVEAEVREILAQAIGAGPLTLVDLLSTEEGSDVEFEPHPLGLSARWAQL